MTEAATRLYISPFNPSLLDNVLGPAIRPLAKDVSFHTIETFPENNYGYVTLPGMEADKLKKKLNGSILKGRKMKVEVARPQPLKRKEIDDDMADGAPSCSPSNSKKRKTEDGVLEGYELPQHRQVKRGWTEPASAKKEKKKKNKADKETDKEGKKPKAQAKSKYTDHAECLFRTRVPPNKVHEGVKVKKSKKRKASPDEVVIHEFAKTITHPSFIKSSADSGSMTAMFDEEKGWIDQNGNVQEAVPEKVRKPSFQPGKKDDVKEKPSRMKSRSSVEPPQEASQNAESSGETTSSNSPESTDSSLDTESDIREQVHDAESDEPTSEEELIGSEDEELEVPPDAVRSPKTNRESSVDSAGSSNSSSVAIAQDSDERENGKNSTASNQDQSVHPLEALFKRPAGSDAKPSEGANTGFSFFGNDDVDEEEEDTAMYSGELVTPSTKQDRQSRLIRSGAPTPDTALAKHIKLLADASDEDMEDAFDAVTPVKSNPVKPQAEESDFVKWFWEHRGENNRAWKKRRRDAAKEQRQRENRRKGLRGRN